MIEQRWHSFRIVYGIGALAVLLDLFTTQLGAAINPHYEQNPIGSQILTGTGPLGDLAILAALGGVVYLSCRLLANRRAHRPLALANGVLAVVVFVRVVVVLAAVLSLAGAVR